ncbi:hypothetical protein MAR_002690 [Mya arenaria]|uniref:Uncharacterized protein n=1 Tax=Mya arenaria TaxID=6604 RepID=A0ABY7G3U5_MYAAR|nr:hypothetical protein MAR_002690 [Mya arenaria]
MKRSDIYEMLLKERWSESCDKINSSSRSEYKDVISTLSEIAFAKLFAEDENQTIVFEIDEEKNVNFASHKDACLKSGIISSTKVPGDSPQYYFLHTTVQEYLAALCISKDSAKRFVDIKHSYKNNRGESGLNLSQILIFLCSINTKAAIKISKEMNKLFTVFCDRNGYSIWESRMLQDTILQGQIELDRSNSSGRKLCLQHISIDEYSDLTLKRNAATDLEQYVKTNQSRIVSLYIDDEHNFAFLFANRRDDKVFDLKNFKGLKYLHLTMTSVKDVIGLNLSHLVECSMRFATPQLAPNLTSTFYNFDIECLQTIQTIDLSGLTDFHWLHKDLERKGIQKLLKLKGLRRSHRGSEQKEILDLRRLGKLEHLTEVGLKRLSYSDVVNLPVFRLHRLEVAFNELQQATQLMSTLLTHGTCQNEQEGLFSRLKDLYLENIRMSEEQFRRLLQSFIKAGVDKQCSDTWLPVDKQFSDTWLPVDKQFSDTWLPVDKQFSDTWLPVDEQFLHS